MGPPAASGELSVKQVAHLLRERKGVNYGSAKLELPDDAVPGYGMGDILGSWLEFFRGKDLVRWLEANPGRVDAVLKDKPGARSDSRLHMI